MTHLPAEPNCTPPLVSVLRVQSPDILSSSLSLDLSWALYPTQADFNYSGACQRSQDLWVTRLARKCSLPWFCFLVSCLETLSPSCRALSPTPGNFCHAGEDHTSQNQHKPNQSEQAQATPAWTCLGCSGADQTSLKNRCNWINQKNGDSLLHQRPQK